MVRKSRRSKMKKVTVRNEIIETEGKPSRIEGAIGGVCDEISERKCTEGATLPEDSNFTSAQEVHSNDLKPTEHSRSKDETTPGNSSVKLLVKDETLVKSSKHKYDKCSNIH